VPIHSSELKTKSGHQVLRSLYGEPVTVDDAREFMAQVATGAPFEHAGHLVVGKLSAIGGEARKVLESKRANPDNPPPVALILTSAVLRMVASLAMRGGGNENLEFFADEAAALAWLDGRMTVYETRRGKR
jgi:hypothetical protein